MNSQLGQVYERFFHKRLLNYKERNEHIKKCKPTNMAEVWNVVISFLCCSIVGEHFRGMSLQMFLEKISI